MPHAVFVHEGVSIDYTPPRDIVAGEVVVQGDLVGVARQPIAANQVGALAVTGVFDFSKSLGPAFAVGTIVYWDSENEVATATATGNKLLGKVVKAAAGSDATVRVRLTQ